MNAVPLPKHMSQDPFTVRRFCALRDRHEKLMRRERELQLALAFLRQEQTKVIDALNDFWSRAYREAAE